MIKAIFFDIDGTLVSLRDSPRPAVSDRRDYAGEAAGREDIHLHGAPVSL